ncbi:MAG: hypothetical protein ABIS18_00320 [Actinomycetota bacterium]
MSSVQTFWRQLFDGQTGTLNLVSGFLVGSRLHGITRKKFSWPEGSAAAASWVAREATLGRDLYQDGFLGSNKKGRPLELSCLFTELHADDLSDFPQPSIVVQLAPGLFQCYWRLSEPVAFCTARKVISQFRWDCNRPMRIPGTPNHRYHGGPVMNVTRSGSESYSATEILDGIPTRPDTFRESVEPVPAFGAELASNLGALGLRAAVAGVAAVVAILGGLAVPDAVSEPSTNVGAVSASFGFNEIRSAVFASPDRVAAERPLTFVSQPVKQQVTPLLASQQIVPGHRPAGELRNKASEFVEAADGIPVQAVILANQARTTWTSAVEIVWNVP